MKTKKAKMWLARDFRTAMSSECWYCLGKTKPTLMREEWVENVGGLHLYAPCLFHRLTGIRLKPGEGPVRVEVSVRLLSKGGTK